MYHDYPPSEVIKPLLSLPPIQDRGQSQYDYLLLERQRFVGGTPYSESGNAKTNMVLLPRGASRFSSGVSPKVS